MQVENLLTPLSSIMGTQPEQVKPRIGFVDLPKEVRCMVYSYVPLARNTKCHGSEVLVLQAWRPSGLYCTCSTIREEMLEVHHRAPILVSLPRWEHGNDWDYRDVVNVMNFRWLRRSNGNLHESRVMLFALESQGGFCLRLSFCPSTRRASVTARRMMFRPAQGGIAGQGPLVLWHWEEISLGWVAQLDRLVRQNVIEYNGKEGFELVLKTIIILLRQHRACLGKKTKVEECECLFVKVKEDLELMTKPTKLAP